MRKKNWQLLKRFQTSTSYSMKSKLTVSSIGVLISILLIAFSVQGTSPTLSLDVTPDNLVLRDAYGNIVATSLTVALINNTDGYVQLARALTESGTVFPTDPAVGYLYYRTDMQSLFIWTGLQWVTAMSATLPPGTISYNDLSDLPDLTVYVLRDGSRPLTADWNTGAFGVYGLTYLNATTITVTDLHATNVYANTIYLGNLLVDPVAPAKGQMWYNSAQDTMKYYNGTAIVIVPGIGGGSSTSYTLPFSYMVYGSGGSYYAESSTGTILTSSTNASAVINNALGNLTIGRNWAESVLLKGNFSLDASIEITSSFTCLTGGDGRATLVLNSGRNVDVIHVSPTVRMVTIKNLIVDQNKGATGTLQTQGSCINATFSSGGALGTPYMGLVLENLLLLEGKTDDLHMVGSTSARLTMTNCETRETGTGGGNTIYLYNVADSFISDCTFQQSYFRGLEASHVTNCYFGGGVTTMYSSCRFNEFVGCRFDYSGTMVLYMTGSLGYTPHDNIFSGCHFLRASRTTNNTSSHIYAEFDTANNQFIGCEFSQGTETNVVKYCFEEKAASSCDNNTLIACTMLGWGTSGVQLQGSHSRVITSVGFSTGFGADPGSYSYTVYVDGATYYARNGMTGLITSNANAVTLINGLFSSAGISVFGKAAVYTLSSSITIGYSNCTLIGEGMGTVFSLANGADCDAIRITGAGVKDVHVFNLAIYGNRDNNALGNGIYIDTSYVYWDACHVLDFLHIRECSESGVYVTCSTNTTRVIFMSHLSIQMCDGRGIYLNATDCFLSDIEIGFSGLSGIHTKASSSKYSSVKTFACGQLGIPEDSAGWTLKGPDAACYSTFVDCVAEDNRYNGWLLYNGVRDDSFTNCWAKNNGASAAGWDGWNITTTCYRLQFTGCWAYDRRDNAFYQYNGFGVYGGCYELVFSGCQATGSDNTGLMLGNSDNCTVTGGFFNNNDNYGLQETSGADYNIIIGVSAMNNGVGGIVTVGANTKVKLCYNGMTWVADVAGAASYTNATRGVERYVILTDAAYTWAVDENGGILENKTFANTNLVITAAFGNLTAGRAWKETVTIKGSYTGLNQILPPSYTIFQIAGSLTAKNALNTDLIYASGKTQIDIIGGKIDGNKAGQTIDMSVVRFVSSTYCTVQYCEITGGFRRDPVASYARGEGIEFATCSYCQALNNYVHDTDYDNIKLRDATFASVISNNICENSEESSNIQLAGDATERNIITNNILIRSDGGSMPVLANIKLHYADRNLIEGNQMYGTNPVSIIGSCDDNIFKNNYIYQVTDAQAAYVFNFYNGGFGENYDNVISDNYVYNCRKRFVQIDDGNRIQILNNRVFSDAAAASHQAVYIASGTVDTRVTDNYFYGLEDGFSNAGTGTIYKDNYPAPYLSENSLSPTNTTALTFVFNHGLIDTATFVWCSFSITGAVNYGYSWSSSSTQITVTLVVFSGSLPASITCYCKCEYAP